MKFNRSTQSGFTLVEVMVVVVIIGLMVAAVAPVVLGRLDDARVERVKADLRTIEGALTLYRVDNFAYPTTVEGLQSLVTEPSTARAWRGPYLQELPIDAWNQVYEYRRPGTRGGDYDLFSLGADGAEGGQGNDADIGNWTAN